MRDLVPRLDNHPDNAPDLCGRLRVIKLMAARASAGSTGAVKGDQGAAGRPALS
jgi:hypothetical protein